MKITIVGGGISGLTLAYALLEKRPETEVVVLEAEDRPGGKVKTDRSEGFVSEAGVNGFLDNKPATLQLARDLGLPPLRSDDNARKRFIYTDGRLKPIPLSPPAFFMSDLLSLKGRLRMLAEIIQPKAVLEDESLESFAVRRVGREFFEKLLDPMASGVYAGDPSRLSLRSCFSKVYELERDHGGLIRGFMALAKARKKTGQKTEAGPGGALHSFTGGMDKLIEALSLRLKDRVLTGKRVTGVERSGSGYTAHCADGFKVSSDRLVIASPAGDAARMLEGMDHAMSALLKEIPYPPLTVVSLGFMKEKLSNVDINGFGFLVPGCEKRRVLGTLFDSSIFHDRAPEGYALIRSMIGGARYPELARLEDSPLLDMVLAELGIIMGLKAEPDFVRIFRWEKAIPQYNLGHHARLLRLDELAAHHKGLYLTGNAYRGVALNDCIANSIALAEEMAR